jgi:hypothetical protein
LAGVHLSGFAAVVSVHSTILSAPVKHTSLTEAVPSLSVALPLQGAPEVIEKPPIGPHELIVVGGTGGCGATCKHPAAINPAIAAPAISNLAIVGLKTATLEIIPRIRPPPQLAYDEQFNPAFATFILTHLKFILPRQSCRVRRGRPQDGEKSGASQRARAASGADL